MEKDRKFRALAIAAICIAVVGVSVAYAALSATLTITGTATVAAASWDIHWAAGPTGSVGNASTAKFAAGSPAISGDDLTFAVTFTAPGDTATINAQIINEGTLPAKLSGNADFLAVTGNEELAQYIDAKMTVDGEKYVDAQGKVLKAGGDVIPVVITLTLKSTEATSNWETISQLTNKTVSYKADLNFVQAADTDVNFFNPTVGA